MLGVFQLLLIVGAKLEHIISELAKEAAESHHGEVTVRLSDELFWFHSPDLVLYLIHFILFQNSFEIAFFLWIWVSESTPYSHWYSFIKEQSQSNFLFYDLLVRPHMDSTLASWRGWITSSQGSLSGNVTSQRLTSLVINQLLV